MTTELGPEKAGQMESLDDGGNTHIVPRPSQSEQSQTPSHDPALTTTADSESSEQSSSETALAATSKTDLLSRPLRPTTSGKTVWQVLSQASVAPEDDVQPSSQPSSCGDVMPANMPSQPTSPHPTTGGKTVWAAAEVSEGEAEEVLARHTTSGKTILIASSYQEEDVDEMLQVADGDDTQKSQQRASTGGKTLMPTVPMPLTQSTATDVEEFMEMREDNTQASQQRASRGGKTVMPTAPMPLTQSTEADADESMEDEDNASDSMDEDDRSSESADEETILSEDASTDIRADMEEVLSGNFEFTGTFAFHRTYSDAPNPALHIDGLGIVGLPLSLRDAAAIKARSSQAPFGMADRTVVDKSVRDTWEIDAKQVRFRNDSSWSEWLREVVRSVCETLGVNHAASQPSCELYKLLLYETGSHFLPHVDTEKQDGMFATVVIVLPSEFTGGAVRVSHSGLTEEYDCSSTSLASTTVLAWYTDVMHEVKPVTSGHRLALSFNLLHTTTSLRPALGGQTQLIGELRRVLLSWKRFGEEEGPQKLICLLDHKYTQANLRGSALKGADAQRVSLLNVLARTLGFHVGLASIVYHESGYGDDDGESYYNRRHWYDEEDEEDDADVGMAEVTDTDIRVENLVDLDGLHMCHDLDFEDTETIPHDLGEMIADGDYDEQEYEGYTGNEGAGSLERWYRRTALVIWPSWSYFGILHGAKGLEYACTRLGNSTSPKPTREEREIADVVVFRAGPSNRDRVIKAAGKAARTWGDLALWQRVVKGCDADSGVRFLGEENVLGAIESFGFEAVRPTLERAFQRDTVNLPAFRFLDRFEEWTKSQHALTMRTVMQIAEWVSVWRIKLLETLKPCASGEVESVLDIAIRVGSVELLERRVLPQIRLTSGPLSILRCAAHLHGLPTLPQEDKSRLVYGSIHAAISKSDLYGPAQEALAIVAGQGIGDETLRKAVATTKHALLLLSACFAMDHEDLIPGIMTKLTDFAGTPPTIAQERAKDVLLPIINELCHKVKQRGPERPIPDMKKLCDTASALYMDWIAASPATLSKADTGSLFDAVECAGEAGTILTQVVPRLEDLRLSAPGIRFIIEELQQRREVLDPTGDALATVLKRLVQRYSSAVPLVVRSNNSYGHGPITSTVDRTNVAAAFGDPFDFCARMDAGEACCKIVSRLIKQFSGNHIQLRGLLDFLIPDIKYTLSKYGRSVSSPAYAPIFRDIMVLWVGTILGRRPSSEVATTQLTRIDAWKCSCQHCKEVRRFLREEAEKTKTWPRIGYRIRQHLDKELGRYCRSSASWKKVSTSPQGISVTKGNAIYEPTRWRAAQLQGLKIFESITSDSREMQATLGDAYVRVASALGVAASALPSATMPLVAQGAPPPAQQVNPSPSASTGSSRVPTNYDGAPPQKRRKTAYDEKEVIDLTSD